MSDETKCDGCTKPPTDPIEALAHTNRHLCEAQDDLAAANAEIERLRAENERLRKDIHETVQMYDATISCMSGDIEEWCDKYAATRDARRVMRFLRHRDPVWEICLGDHPPVDVGQVVAALPFVEGHHPRQIAFDGIATNENQVVVLLALGIVGWTG